MPKAVPAHIAIVMDGNGRWATKRGLPRSDGHRAGEEAVQRTVHAAADLGVRNLTLYAFSTENWRRPKAEVRFLMNDTIDLVERLRGEFHARGIRMRWIGRRDWRVPKKILRLIDETTELTKRNKGMTLTIAFNYGSRTELVDAVRKIANDTPAKIDEQTIARSLYDAELPDVDLFIRTGGEHRLSNYLLWQSSYAELVFTDVLWPDYGPEPLQEAIE
ncbi:MAG: di-trans,poly-cis-decaprenylcistransferase, partial [Actinobacteria bacterium]|nr:di-trans,poly-cis-decaprenylcistransferase [Actinomycetota bacterium]